MPQLFLFATLFLALPAHALTLPEPVFGQAVYDFADVLSPQEERDLTQYIVVGEQKGSQRVVVVIVQSLQGATIEDFAAQLFEKWKLREEKKDYVVLVLLAPVERAVRIQRAYRRDELTLLDESTINGIIKNEMIPELRKGNFNRAVWKGVDSIFGTIDLTVFFQEGEKLTKSRTGSWINYLAYWFVFVVEGDLNREIGYGLLILVALSALFVFVRKFFFQ